jgi:para-nitrobenzyl esterase
MSDPSREDCLYLNVWTPRAAAGAKLPVMVWIHGGGFVNGATNSPTYDGARLASEGVVVVTVAYRLGVFGFLAHPELTAESAHRSSGNFGLEDQLAALRWVAANAAAFGGDPNNVTLFGQSAGGASVVDLFTSPHGKGLFHRAIVESGAARGGISVTPLARAEQHGLAFASGRSIANLRKLDVASVWQHAGTGSAAGVRFGPVRDGYLIPRDPREAMADPAREAVPLLLGSNSREGLATPPAEALVAAISSAFGANTDSALEAYGLANGGTGRADPLMGTPAQQFATDSTFRCGTVEMARLSAASGNPTWQYQFEQFVPSKEAQGAAHSFEVPYVFGNLLNTGFSAADYGPADRALSDVMVRYWSNFAKRGDPNGPGLPAWPKYQPTTKGYLRLASTLPGNAQAATDLRGEVCRLFTSNTVVTGERS